jgi:outer membrane protein OmpA-like peptidoglycan-associated protein
MAEHGARTFKAASVVPAGPVLQRRCACGTHTPDGGGECDACSRSRAGVLQRRSAGGEAGAAIRTPADGTAPAIVAEVLHGSGRPLDAAARAFMESRLGHDFSRVRVHTDSKAAASARAVGALAYTVGQQIVFGSGRYAPGSGSGRHLLAHELAHTVQQRGQGGAIAPRLALGAAGTEAEVEADRVADRVMTAGPVPAVRARPAAALQRQPAPDDAAQAEPDFRSPQQRGGRPRAAFVDAGRRGDDQVRVAVTRYLCDCVGRSVTKKSAATRIHPGPGVTLEFCRGSVTVRLKGDVVPSGLTTGTATLRAELNRAGGPGGTGVKAGVEGVLRNTGSEPQGGVKADLRLKPPGGPQIGVEGEYLRGTQTGKTDTQVGVGVQIGDKRLSVEGTNLQDDRRGGMVVLGGTLPGQDVEEKTCRECRCPAVYECLTDTLPRDYEEPVSYDIEERSRLRYYFSLDTNQDTRDAVLRAESTRALDTVAQRVAGGARVRAVTGYASPEDNRERPTPNQQLSLSRARRLHDMLASRLGAGVPLPEPEAGGELLGRVATIAPGSRLADAIVDAGFGDPEDVSAFLVGSDIPTQKLSDQFLALLQRVTEPADRLRLFGVDTASPAAPRLLAAVEQFIRSRGRGGRPWENVFGFLRYATVELSQTHRETRQEQRRTSGSLEPMSDGQCKPCAARAEGEGRFGPAAPEPKDAADCPSGEAHNLPRFAGKCRYD